MHDRNKQRHKQWRGTNYGLLKENIPFRDELYVVHQICNDMYNGAYGTLLGLVTLPKPSSLLLVGCSQIT